MSARRPSLIDLPSLTATQHYNYPPYEPGQSIPSWRVLLFPLVRARHDRNVMTRCVTVSSCLRLGVLRCQTLMTENG